MPPRCLYVPVKRLLSPPNPCLASHPSALLLSSPLPFPPSLPLRLRALPGEQRLIPTRSCYPARFSRPFSLTVSKRLFSRPEPPVQATVAAANDGGLALVSKCFNQVFNFVYLAYGFQHLNTEACWSAGGESVHVYVCSSCLVYHLLCLWYQGAS